MDTQNKQSWTVIKLGGSIMVPGQLPDEKYLELFRDLIIREVDAGKKFCIIAGGGATARSYQATLESLGMGNNEKDWIGIHAVRLNAALLTQIFGSRAHPSVCNEPKDIPEDGQHSIVICGAAAPGHSANYNAVVFADILGADEIINLSNIDYVYSADPRKVPDAKRYPEVSWSQYLTFIPEKWLPGMSVPFDQEASALAQKSNIDVAFMKGNPINNLETYLQTGEVEGSVISNRFE